MGGGGAMASLRRSPFRHLWSECAGAGGLERTLSYPGRDPHPVDPQSDFGDGLENTPAGRGQACAHGTTPFRYFVVRADPFSGRWAELPRLGGAAVRRLFRRGSNVAGLFAGPAVSPVPCGSPRRVGSAWGKAASARSSPGIGLVHGGASCRHPGRRLERSHSTHGRAGRLARTRHVRLPNPPARGQLFRGHDSGSAVAGRSRL